MRCVWLVVALLAVACGGKKDQIPPVDKTSAPATAPTKPAAASDGLTAAFWTWFSQHAAELRADKNIEATMEKITAELAKLDAGLFAEIGADHDDRTLVLSVDGKKELFPIVQKVYAARPTIPGWKILAFRQRDSGFAIEMEGKKIEPRTVKFVATPNGNKLDVEVFMPAFTDHDQMAQIGFVMLDHSVGEYDMETKIGGIEFSPLAKAPATAKSLVELGTAVDALK